MFWLFVQTWIWLLIAALIGLFVGWLIWRNSGGDNSSEIATLRRQLDECRKASASQSTSSTSTAQAATSATADIPVVKDEWKPAGLDAPNGAADDLKRISGVGPVIEKTLNGLGIYHFQQVADFTPDNVKWVDNFIDFPGRINREGWVEQARKLGDGVETDFSKRYDNKS